MDISTDILGLKQGVIDSLENANELLDEVSAEAEKIMQKAYDEFNAFLEKKGLENKMGVLCPKDDVKVIYHITDIEWDVEELDPLELTSNLPTSIDVENINEDIAEFLFDKYSICVKSYKSSVEIIKNIESHADIKNTNDNTSYPPKAEVMYASITIGTNNNNCIHEKLFNSEDDAIKYCKSMFQLAIKNGKSNGNLLSFAEINDPYYSYRGEVFWKNRSKSVFAVKAFKVSK